MKFEKPSALGVPITVGDQLRSKLMHVLPHHVLSAMMHTATRIKARAWKNWQINWFIQRYAVDMDIAQIKHADQFEHFNAFFTRELRDDARPLSDMGDALLCPADGAISAAGTIAGDSVFQAKGQDFSLQQLLGGDAQRAAAFYGGQFCTIYLSPRDYHRVHMPLTGTLREMIHIPGRLFSVNPISAQTVPRLFARNERVVSIFDTQWGPMAVILVGAVFVGSIEQVWAGEVAPNGNRDVSVTRYSDDPQAAVNLHKGAQMGRFNMGSTVILALPAGSFHWREDLQADSAVRMGEMLAMHNGSSTRSTMG